MNSSLPLEADSCADSDPRVTAALQEYIHLLEHGTDIERQGWFQRHAEILPQMRDSLEGLRLLQAAAPALRSALAETECVLGTDASLLEAHGAEPLGDFLLRKQIGRGGMGVVYEACQLSLGRSVAVKLLPFAAAFDPTLLRRFRQEAQAAAQLHHPHIVPVFTVGCERGLHYYAMQLIDGRSLATVIEELRVTCSSPDSPEALAISVRQPLWFRTVAQFGFQAAQALSFAHEQGIVHRDIKPANLLVDSRGELFVTDFGLAATRENVGLTMSGNLLGTLRYASPEQLLGKRALVDHRTDIYSLGATLYELVTLVPPFPGDDHHSLLQNIAHTSPKPPRHFNPALPVDLETILLKAISRDRDDRFESAYKFAAELQRFLEGRPIQTRRPSLIDRTWKKIARRPRLAIGAFAALLVSVAVLAASTILITRARNHAVRLQELAETQAERLADLQQVAEQRRLAAMEHEQSKLWQRYASDLRLAELMLQHFKLAEAQHLLRRYIPPETAVDIREFAWRYLWQRCRSGRQELRGHHGAVYYISWAPDGTSLATASEDGTVRLWEVPSGRLIRILEGHLGEVNCVSFSNAGKKLASASDDRTVRLWDSDGKSPPKVFAGHNSSVVGVAFSQRDDFLVSVDHDGMLFVWEPGTGESLGKVQAHSGRIQAVEISPDGRRMATAGEDSTVRIWDVTRLPDLQPLQTLHGPEASIHCLAWSHDGIRLATGDWDATLRIWEGGDNNELRKLSTCAGGVESVAFSHDDRHLACATAASVVQQFEMPNGLNVGHLLGHVDRCWCVRFSPKGDFLASSSSDGDVNLWPADPAARQIETRTSYTVRDLRFDSTGRHLISVDVADEMQLREPRSGKTLFEFSDDYDNPLAIACTSDGLLIAADAERDLEFWNLRVFPPQRVRHPMSGQSDVSSVSRDGTLLICGNDENEIWNVARHERFPMTTTFYGQPLFSPGAQWVVDCCPNGSLWSPGTNHRLPSQFVIHPEQLEFSSDGKTLFAGSAEGLIRRFRVGDSKPLFQYLGSDAFIEDLALSPDGSTLVAGGSDGALRFWNVNSEHEMFSIQSELGPVRAVAFSPDGQSLVYSTGPESPDKGSGAIRILRGPLLEPQP